MCPDDITGTTEPTAVTQFAAAAARLLQEPTTSPPPMSFDAASLDPGTVKLTPEETEQTLINGRPESKKPDATLVVERAQFQTSAPQDPDATVVKQVHQPSARSQRYKVKRDISWWPSQYLPGSTCRRSDTHLKQSQESVPQIMSGPVIIESKPAGALVVFSGRDTTQLNTKYARKHHWSSKKDPATVPGPSF